MSKAFKCDSCGEYADGSPMVVTLIPPTMTDASLIKTLKYDLCPFCANAVIEEITCEKAYGDYAKVTETELLENVTAHVMECSECGHTHEHVNGSYRYCPHCKAKFICYICPHIK